MEHIKQNPKECLLAAVCMVKGLDYEHVRAVFQTGTGQSWGDALAAAKGDFLIKVAGVRIPVVITDGTPIGSQEVDLCGRGILLITLSWATRVIAAHAVAFEDGVIYDSNLEGPLPWKDWRERREQWEVYEVIHCHPIVDTPLTEGAEGRS